MVGSTMALLDNLCLTLPGSPNKESVPMSMILRTQSMSIVAEVACKLAYRVKF